MKTLKTEKDRLKHLMKHQKEVLKPVSKERKTLHTVQANMDSILGIQHETRIGGDRLDIPSVQGNAANH